MSAAEIYLGLGSNLGDRLENLRTALRSLDAGGATIMKVSSVYETEPVGPPQPLYLNAVCLAETHLSPLALLGLVKRLEEQIGRTPSGRWGPRVIDLDILLYDGESVESEDLTIPHPRLQERPFVLKPLYEIAPEAKLPNGEVFAGKGDPFPEMVPWAQPEDLWRPGAPGALPTRAAEPGR